MQRYRCPNCDDTQVKKRSDLTQAQQLEHFVGWLLGKNSQAEFDTTITDRTWRNRTKWCWEIIPKPMELMETPEIILLDGIRIGVYVCLIAKTTKRVIAWQWVGWESSFSWSLLLEKIPSPKVVVCDGQKGILLAIARTWLDTRIQRCTFHVWQNVRVKLTLHPQTEAGRQLLKLTKDLWQIQTTQQACMWQRSLENWKEIYFDLIRERTYLTNSRKSWWYTHRRLRSAYRQLEKLLKDKQLFTYIENLTCEPIPRTTNYVEGGINSQLRTLLKLHRGLNQTHQMRLVDWYLYSRSKGQKPTRNFL